jgi:hypothetical protein
MKLVKKVKRKIVRTRNVIAAFGYRVAFTIELLPLVTPRRLRSRFLLYKHAFLGNYIARRYAGVIDTFLNTRRRSYNLQKERYCDGQRIWVFWWQGEQKMPPIVRACYSSVRRLAPDEQLVTLLAKDNVADFIDLPKYIFDKVESGIISLAHLSDIIEVALLFQRGGLWIDATVFVSKPITPDILSADFFTLKAPYSIEFPGYGRWTTFLIGGRQGSPVFQLLRDLLLAYWEKENILIDYFLFDYMFVTAYARSEEVRFIIDSVGPHHGRGIFDLASCLNQEFECNIFSQVTNKAMFHKLSWKPTCRLTTTRGTGTVYAHIVGLSEA